MLMSKIRLYFYKNLLLFLISLICQFYVFLRVKIVFD